MQILHNPRCSKSRETLKLLQENGQSPEIVEYLKSPPTQKRLKEIAVLLGVGPREMMRTKEAVYKELGLAEASDAALFKAMAENPVLIERPIVISGHKAVIGRPPENALSLV